MADIDILIEAPGWETIPGITAVVERAADVALSGEGMGEASVSILLSDDETVRTLNAQYRDKDRPTNVLSFPAPLMPGMAERILGDIILAYQTCRDEAISEHKTLTDHVSHLVVHGVLHLCGHDHETEDEAEVMEAREIALLAALGIANPYLDPPEPLA